MPLGQAPGFRVQVYTHRPLSSSFLGLPYRILNMNHKKELLGSVLWIPSKVSTSTSGFRLRLTFPLPIGS